MTTPTGEDDGYPPSPVSEKPRFRPLTSALAASGAAPDDYVAPAVTRGSVARAASIEVEMAVTPIGAAAVIEEPAPGESAGASGEIAGSVPAETPSAAAEVPSAASRVTQITSPDPESAGAPGATAASPVGKPSPAGKPSPKAKPSPVAGAATVSTRAANAEVGKSGVDTLVVAPVVADRAVTDPAVTDPAVPGAVDGDPTNQALENQASENQASGKRASGKRAAKEQAAKEKVKDRPRTRADRRRRRSPLWAKAFVVFGILLMITGTGAVFLVNKGVAAVENAIPQADLLGDDPQVAAPTFTGNQIDGPLNILIVGVDASGAHTDSIIIAHIPALHQKVYLISIPRDTEAYIPGVGDGYKINYAFGVGGFPLLAKTIKQDYGISFNAAVSVNFNGFKDIVTELGGVDMYVDETTHSIHHGYVGDNMSDHAKPYNINPNSGVPICYNHHYTFQNNADKCTLPGVHEVTYLKGWRHLSAYDALDFVRCRDGLVGTDYARQRHQQQFIKAVLTEAYSKGLADPFKLSSFLESLGKAFTFDGNKTSIADWIFTLKGLSPGAMITIKTNDGQYASYTGHSYDGSEQTLSADSLDLLNAVRDDASGSDGKDSVAGFLSDHGDWISAS